MAAALAGCRMALIGTGWTMATLELFTLGGGVWGMLPQEILAILGVLGCILVHSEAYRAHRAS